MDSLGFRAGGILDTFYLDGIAFASKPDGNNLPVGEDIRGTIILLEIHPPLTGNGFLKDFENPPKLCLTTALDWFSIT